MEQKKNNILVPLFWYSLKDKKNWFLMSTVLVLVSTMLIPFILETNEEFFAFLGIFEVFVLVFINCLMDNSFLHSDNKLAYYKSKPVSLREQISINITINIIFAMYLLILIILSVAIQDLDYYSILDTFKMFVPWILVGIFLTTLSSILSGNTLMAAVMTVFNFALPAIIYLIVQFMFSILENMVAGFSARVLMDYFAENFYKLEYIYFTVYLDKSKDFMYYLILCIMLVVITVLISKVLKKRKNENTGSFIVFNGYKYFVSVLVSLIIPAFLSIVSYGQGFVREIAVSLLVAALAYYVIIAVMERSFKVSKLSVKVFSISMVMFIAMTGGTVAVASHYKDVIPAVEDVKFAYIGNNGWVYNRIKSFNQDGGELSESDITMLSKEYGSILLTDKENIETITNLHREILSDNSYYFEFEFEYYYNPEITIVYGMKDGSLMIRSYKIDDDSNANSNANSNTKDELTVKLLSSHEFKEKKYYYLYDENYYSSNDYSVNFRLWYDGMESAPVSINEDAVRQCLMKDIDEKYGETDKSFLMLLNYDYDMPYFYAGEYNETEYYLDIEVINNNFRDNEVEVFTGEVTVLNINPSSGRIYTIYLDDNFKNTRKYLNIE